MQKDSLNKFKYSVLYLLAVHIGALLLFFTLRLVLFLHINYDFAPEIAASPLIQAKAFLIGLWYDNVIACYILALPLIVFWVSSLLNRSSVCLFRIANVWFIVLYSLAFLISTANVPYFEYFFKIINSSIFEWFSYGTQTFGMVTGEKTYMQAFLLFLALAVVFAIYVVLLSRCMRKKIKPGRDSNTLSAFLKTFVLGAVLGALCFLGIRGRTGYNPIKVSGAYYCSDPFLNQLGINPAFNLLNSVRDDNRSENKQLELMDDGKALSMAIEFLDPSRELTPDASILLETSTSPLQTSVGSFYCDSISPFAGRNIVIVFMESMSMNLTGAVRKEATLTPAIDSLWRNSLHFSNFYSAGIHTNHGMYSSLYSFPSIMKRNAMKGSVIPQYSGLPTELKRMGYRNLFFMTHESQYDNMNGFFRTNGFDEIYAQENYPSDKVVNSFGVQDDFLYSYALPVLDARAAEGRPFFAVLLSISNHPPYVLPDWFKAKSSDIEDAIVEYADHSIEQFMKDAASKDWFDNTIFVFLGDHGKMVGSADCEVPTSYNHVPLMIYGTGIEAMEIDSFCGQIDLAPTLLGMLGAEYMKNNFGVDVLHNQRPCIYYGSDNMIAARSSDKLFIYSPENSMEYRYDIDSEGKLSFSSDEEKFKPLKEYCFSMLQSTEYLVHKGLTIVDYGQSSNNL